MDYLSCFLISIGIKIVANATDRLPLVKLRAPLKGTSAATVKGGYKDMMLWLIANCVSWALVSRPSFCIIRYL